MSRSSRRSRLALPPEVVGPLHKVTDVRGALLGYAMRAISGADEFGQLQNRRFRQGAVPNAHLLALFSRLREVLAQLHARNVVVGDLNDGNLLFAGDALSLIDADSMQFAGLPCAVGHERYLDPRLYGVDLSLAPAFSPGTDWYSFAVMLFSSLLCVHPFGGVQKKLPTLVRRAEARHSVMRPDVVFPRAGIHFKVLPDEALGWFERVFEKDARDQVPARLLQMQFSTCSCGLEHARAVCPECQTLGPASARQAISSNGRCTARSVFRTTGRVLAAAMQGGLRYAYEENSRVRREDGSLVLDAPATVGMRFGINGPSTWVAGRSGRVTRVRDEQVVERASTSLVGVTPIIATSAAASYRLEQEWLVEQTTGARIGQVLENQTRVWTGERMGFGFYRAGGLTVAFVMRTGRSGLKQVALPPITGRLIDADCVFDDRHALFSALTEVDGRQSGIHFLIDEHGTVIASGETVQARGKALLGGRVVCATNQGLLSLKIDSGRLLPGTAFPDSAPFVDPTDELFAQADGSLLIVGTTEIMSLSLS